MSNNKRRSSVSPLLPTLDISTSNPTPPRARSSSFFHGHSTGSPQDSYSGSSSPASSESLSPRSIFKRTFASPNKSRTPSLTHSHSSITATITPTKPYKTSLPIHISPQTPLLQTPPKVTPYIIASSTEYAERRGSQPSLTCVFCQESLSYTFSGERVLSLQCSHVAHQECFNYLISDVGLSASDKNLALPKCPVCAKGAHLTDEKLWQEMYEKKMVEWVLSPPSPPLSSTLEPIVEFTPPIDLKPLREFGDKLPPTPCKSVSPTTMTTQDDNENSDIYSPMPYLPPPEPLENPSSSPSQITLKDFHLIFSPLALEKTPANSTHVTPETSCVDLLTTNISKTATRFEVSKSSKEDDEENAPEVRIIPEYSTVVTPFVTCLVEVKGPSIAHSDNKVSSNLQQVTENLIVRMQNWHKLDPRQFGGLKLVNAFQVSKNLESWQSLLCFLFDKILICCTDEGSAGGYKLKGSMVLDGLESKITSEKGIGWIIGLSAPQLPQLYLKNDDAGVVKRWYNTIHEGTDKEYSELTKSTKAIRMSPSVGVGQDLIVAIPINGSAKGHTKFKHIRASLRYILTILRPADRLGVIMYGHDATTSFAIGMASATWPGWNHTISHIKPTNTARPYGHDQNNDVFEGVHGALKLLKARHTRNPTAGVFLLSDSAHNRPDRARLQAILSESDIDNEKRVVLPIHTFGVDINHAEDALVEISRATAGRYVYVRNWPELVSQLANSIEFQQSLSHKGVELEISPLKGFKFAYISGTDNQDGPVIAQTTTTPFSTTTATTTIRMGNLAAGQTRSFLVQVVKVEAESLIDEWTSLIGSLDDALNGKSVVNLFNTKISYYTLEAEPVRIQIDCGNLEVQMASQLHNMEFYQRGNNNNSSYSSDIDSATSDYDNYTPDSPSDGRYSFIQQAHVNMLKSPLSSLSPFPPLSPLSPFSPLYAENLCYLDHDDLNNPNTPLFVLKGNEDVKSRVSDARVVTKRVELIFVHTLNEIMNNAESGSENRDRIIVGARHLIAGLKRCLGDREEEAMGRINGLDRVLKWIVEDPKNKSSTVFQHDIKKSLKQIGLDVLLYNGGSTL